MFNSLFSKKYNIKRPHGELEFQDVFMDRLAHEQTNEHTKERLEVPVSAQSSVVFFALFLLVAVIFTIQSFGLQVFQGNAMTALAQRNAVRTTLVPPDRGVIYDRNFIQLVTNKPSFDVVCDQRYMPHLTTQKEVILQELSRSLNMDFQELKELFGETPTPEVLVKENISHEELVLLQAKTNILEGCGTKETTKREYVGAESLAHVLGYTAKISEQELYNVSGYSVADQIGKVGVEKAYEQALRGIPGKVVIERDAYGTIQKELGEIPAQEGENVVLWLDENLQEQAQKALERVFANTGTKKGAAVALDPQTGGVLAMVSLPSFDANMFSGGISSTNWNMLLQDSARPLFNRALSGIGYPTGSVIKPLVAAAALQEGIIQENSNIYAPLELCVKNIYTKEDECFRDWSFHGWSDVKRAIAESVNTFFYIIGGGHEGTKGLGPNAIKEYVEKFGWGNPTGIDIAGEGQGILPTLDKNWRLGDTYHFSIGQGPFAITPLQVATAFGAIANGGELLEPKVARFLVNGDRAVTQRIESVVVAKDMVSSENLEVVRQGMRQTVTAGSATGWLDKIPVEVAAKTGTAQTGRTTYEGKDYLYSWTVAFAPYDNPEIVFVVVVEDVQEGNVAALPVVRDVLQWYFTP